MSYLNLMGNKLKPKEVNDALESIPNGTPTPTEISAVDVGYNNSTSHLSATNVQSAIDELAIPNVEKIEITASTNANGKITISNTDVPLDSLISIIVKSPTGDNVLVYRGSQSYGCVVTEQGALTPVASTECVLEITKFK